MKTNKWLEKDTQSYIKLRNHTKSLKGLQKGYEKFLKSDKDYQ
jgi:hypothetical protein